MKVIPAIGVMLASCKFPEWPLPRARGRQNRFDWAGNASSGPVDLGDFLGRW
jgi:hypothetical protein